MIKINTNPNFSIIRKRIGIFPGSFDPLHQGHLKIIKFAITQLNLDEIFIIPIINTRKNQTSLKRRFNKLVNFFKENPKIIVVYYDKSDYLSLIKRLVIKYKKDELYRLMGETCYNAYPEVGIPPLRDEPDLLNEILKTQNVVIMPNPPTNHRILKAKIVTNLPKKIIVLRLPEENNRISFSSVNQKIKASPFLGLKELRYNRYYLKNKASRILDFKDWEERYWHRSSLKIGLSHGTFDTVHDGHLNLWKEGIRQLNLDAVFVWPSLNPKHKPKVHSFRYRYNLLAHTLSLEPKIHLLRNIKKFLSNFGNEKDIIKQILCAHENVVDWIRCNLPQSTKYHRLFGSDSFNDYSKMPKETRQLTNPLHTMTTKGFVVVLERIAFPLPKKLPLKVIILKHTHNSCYFSGLSHTLIKETYKKYGHLLVGQVNSKHIPQNMIGKRAELFDRLANKVGYKYSRIGFHKNYSHIQDVKMVHKMAKENKFRPVKFVITKDGRIWADNSHWALVCIVRYGPNVTISNVSHYFIDLRTNPPTVINRPKTLTTPQLKVAVDYALEIQDRLDRGWRLKNLVFTIGELFYLGNYNRI